MIHSLKIATAVYITQKEEQCHCELFQAKYFPSPLHYFLLQSSSQVGIFNIQCKLEKITGGCELMGLICGRHNRLRFLLILGTQPLYLSILFLPFRFLPPPFFLPPYHLKLCSKAISKSCCLYLYQAGSNNLGLCSQVQLKLSCRRSICQFARPRAGSLPAVSAPLHTCIN